MSPILRPWVYCKLRHFDSLGQPLSNVVKRQLAVLWNMPEIEQGERVRSNPIAVEKDIRNITLEDDSETVEIEDDSLEALTQRRGIFLVSTTL